MTVVETMMSDYIRLGIKVSRSRFWFYTAGPFTVGCIWGANRFLDLANPEFFIYLFYFLIPANVFLYGVNDYWDRDTDLLNPKKEGKEYVVNDSDRGKLKDILTLITALSLLLMVFQKNWGERIIFGVFLFLSYFYSAKPFRFKTVPLLDSASNVLYALPGVFAYYQVTGALPPQNVMLAAFLHSSAMHLFSAIPDIEYDRKVNLKTTAVLLGVKVSTFLCLMLWSAFSILAVNIGGFAPLSFLTVVYPALVLTVIVKRMKVISVYWLYPYLNTGLGGLLFLIGAMQTPFR